MAGETPTVRPGPVRKGATRAAKSNPRAATASRPTDLLGVRPDQSNSMAVTENRPSPYTIMAGRLANRVAELAEGITFIERPRSSPQPNTTPKKPRKLELRLERSQGEEVSFSAPFLNNTLSKMLQLQQRMLGITAQLSASSGVTEEAVKEHAAQSAELSRIIAMICAEKARQGG